MRHGLAPPGGERALPHARWRNPIWGLLHAVFFSVTTLWSRWGWSFRPSSSFVRGLLTVIQVGVTFHLVCFARIFFRANTFPDALLVIRKIGFYPLVKPFFPYVPSSDMWLTAAAVLVVEGVHILHRSVPGGSGAWLDRRTLWIRRASYYAIITAIFLLAPSGQREFIYFRF